VGRLIPDNNSDLILEGFLQSLSDKKLVIVGDVPFQDAFAKKIKARSQTTDRVIMTGYVNEAKTLAELYHHCYAYLHGHEFGGTNPTMLKAMAYGCAILALKTPFNNEMLADGDFGDFFNKSVDSISEKIKDFDLHPKRVTNLKNHSRSGISKKYTWDHVCNQYIDAIYGLMDIR
jgi:glycosyltransferase involved in cell wall biosynthesis